jgi:hypothetical protein
VFLHLRAKSFAFLVRANLTIGNNSRSSSASLRIAEFARVFLGRSGFVRSFQLRGCDGLDERAADTLRRAWVNPKAFGNLSDALSEKPAATANRAIPVVSALSGGNSGGRNQPFAKAAQGRPVFGARLLGPPRTE